jgi:O-antigen/teichoic acid export membrane protein
MDDGGARVTSGLERRLVDGSAWTALAALLALPTGVITAGVLGRGLGPADYGVLTLAGTTVALIEYALKSVFARPSVKLVAEAADWPRVGGTLLRLGLATYAAAAVALWLGSDRLAAALGAPRLGGVLKVFSLELPLFALTQAHHHVLVGRGRFRARAAAMGAYWLARLAFVFTAAALGLSLPAAAVALIAATAVELAVCRWSVQLPLLGGFDVDTRRGLARHAAALAPAEVALRVLASSDLLALSALGVSAERIGVYAAAGQLPLAVWLVGGPLSLLVLSSAARARRDGDDAAARAVGGRSIRLVLLAAPFVLAIGGAAPALLTFVFGARYAAPSALVAPMLVGALARLLILVALALLAATSRPARTAALALPLLPAAAAGYAVLVPGLDLLGAALASAAVSVVGAIVALIVVERALGVPVFVLGPFLGRLARQLVVTEAPGPSVK